MTIKRIVLILFLIISVILLATRFLSSIDQGTTITIRNQTDQCLKDLVFVSNANKEGFNISNIAPQTAISFQYDIGGFNENAVNLQYISELGDIKNYNIIGYVYEFYSHIYIDIISISPEGKLNIKVETLK
ncbi:hypothetical protein [Clostridium formicaceticum]|uniref:Uncharacterized protein n=1 Tax=Clostridium formicaceticum TaxID=1497 RepID=A0AAC9RM81_9CLOT|nr:hypothetical protein [Clostridium formicaceticum]AOY77579.1 hypothetical protein BJL90_17990 [Clostridium formicaceticum]ARE88157.1 hypothetical protein CLFO_25580 [Clostridium formicaceticum]